MCEKRMGEDVFSAFDKCIAQPLQFQHWSKQEFRLRAMDMARFGQLFLNNSRSGGRQILPARWVKESTRAQVTLDKQAGGYGYMWWVEGPCLPKGSYSAQGNGGHMILVVPSHSDAIAQ